MLEDFLEYRSIPIQIFHRTLKIYHRNLHCWCRLFVFGVNHWNISSYATRVPTRADFKETCLESSRARCDTVSQAVSPDASKTPLQRTNYSRGSTIGVRWDWSDQGREYVPLFGCLQVSSARAVQQESGVRGREGQVPISGEGGTGKRRQEKSQQQEEKSLHCRRPGSVEQVVLFPSEGLLLLVLVTRFRCGVVAGFSPALSKVRPSGASTPLGPLARVRWTGPHPRACASRAQTATLDPQRDLHHLVGGILTHGIHVLRAILVNVGRG